jgi:hypothetical protein
MASAWICHDSAEYPPESTIATGIDRSRIMDTTSKPLSVRSPFVSRYPARGSSTYGSDPAL